MNLPATQGKKRKNAPSDAFSARGKLATTSKFTPCNTPTFLLGALLATTLLTACGDSGSSPNPPANQPPASIDSPRLCGPFTADPSATTRVRTIPYLPSARDPFGRLGVLRVLNRSDEEGPVWITAIDDQGHSFGPVTLSMCANQMIELDSMDLEKGNSAKGLADATGAGQGDWRLEFSSALEFDVLSRLVMSDGYAAPIQATAAWEDGGHRIATFNPGSNLGQESRLRLINLGDTWASATISATDDAGNPSAGMLSLQVPAAATSTWTAAELESGAATGLVGSLGDGVGSWQLAINSDRPLLAMSLLAAPNGYLSNLSPVPAHAQDAVHRIPFLPSTSNVQGSLGLVRVINHSNRAGEVSILAFDDAGLAHGPLILPLAARETKHFDSKDLEQGNPRLGLTAPKGTPTPAGTPTSTGTGAGTGTGTGDWRLEFTSPLGIEVLVYLKALDGFLTAMHNQVPRTDDAYHLPAFWFGGDASQGSLLRLVNPGKESAQITIKGIDEDGESSTGSASLELAPGASRTLKAQELESGGDRIDGSLGTSTPKGTGADLWRLVVESEQPITVLNLLSSPTGSLANLSLGAAETRTVKFNFDGGAHRFVADFSDYPQGDAIYYRFKSAHQRMPAPLDSESGLYISGRNHSGGLFMFFKGQVGGLVPGARYAVTAGAEIATSVPSGCAGVGGPPGESVWIKVGVSDIEPLPAPDGGWLRMNIDIGAQSRSGKNAQVLGNVANSRSCEQPSQWERKSFPVGAIATPVIASPKGRVWLLLGVDSGFESRTEIYFTQTWATFER